MFVLKTFSYSKPNMEPSTYTKPEPDQPSSEINN